MEEESLYTYIIIFDDQSIELKKKVCAAGKIKPQRKTQRADYSMNNDKIE